MSCVADAFCNSGQFVSLDSPSIDFQHQLPALFPCEIAELLSTPKLMFSMAMARFRQEQVGIFYEPELSVPGSARVVTEIVSTLQRTMSAIVQSIDNR